MNQDKSIVHKTKIQTNCVVINQCNRDSLEEYDFQNNKGVICHVKYICTTERGLSRSRNMAIQNCSDNICLVCDDDEEMADNYENLILEGYNTFPDASIIAYSLKREDCGRTYPSKSYKIGFVKLFKVNSVQITFKRKDVIQEGISFDVMLGSGTGNGGGEENKFLLDCYKARLNIYYHTNLIATVLKRTEGESLWFSGYNASYMEKLGWSSRRIMGNFWGKVYGIYFVLSHREKYKASISMMGAFKYLTKGWKKEIN